MRCRGPFPLHYQIPQILLDQIVSRQYQEDGQLPTKESAVRE